MSNQHRARRAGVGAVLAALILAATVLVSAPSPASAAGILPTTTSLTSTANPALGESTVTLTATIKILGTNLGPITPRGTVTFLVEDALPVVAPVGSCLILLTQCKATATITTPAYDALNGPNEVAVTAIYSGDLLSAASSASLVQQVTGPVVCNSTFDCSSSRESANGSAALRVDVPGGDDEGLYEISIWFTSVPMSCSRANTGDIAVFDVTLERFKIVRFDTYNQAAVTANSQPNRICWGSDSPFITASGVPATQVSVSPPFYEGLLPACAIDGTLPCVDTSETEFQPAQPPDCDCDPRARLRNYILAPPGDPKSGR